MGFEEEARELVRPEVLGRLPCEHHADGRFLDAVEPVGRRRDPTNVELKVGRLRLEGLDPDVVLDGALAAFEPVEVPPPPAPPSADVLPRRCRPRARDGP